MVIKSDEHVLFHRTGSI